MILAVCIDIENGLTFNNRRLSRDSAVINELLNYAKSIDKKIFITPFSEILFKEYDSSYYVFDNFEKAEACGIYFCEHIDDINSLNPETVIIYNWNRVYPADVFFNTDLNNFTLINEENFAGNSHEKITKSIYKRI